MIFLTAFTHSIIVDSYKHKRQAGQFYEEYKVLLKSINKIYPEATPVLFLFEGICNINELRKLHPKVFVFNWQKYFKPELGIDLNYLLALKETIQFFDENIIMIDPDCIIVKRFDEYIDDDYDVTVVTRGHIKWNNRRNDIIFAPAIYNQKKLTGVISYIDHLFVKGYKNGVNTGDWWANVQPEVTQIYIEAGINLDINFDGFPSSFGRIKIDDKEIKLKVVPQYVLSYPIQDEKYYPETRIIHYKNYKYRSTPEEVFKKWGDRKD